MELGDTFHRTASSFAVAPFRYASRISFQLSSLSRNHVGCASSILRVMG